MIERLTQWCAFECACGRKGGQTLGHYDRVQCGGCGKTWWALAPGRNAAGGYGPLKLFPWPGFPGLTPAQSSKLLTVKP